MLKPPQLLIANEKFLRHSWAGFEEELEICDEEDSRVPLKQNRPQNHLEVPQTAQSSGLLSPISNLSHSLDMLGFGNRQNFYSSPTKGIEAELPSTVEKILCDGPKEAIDSPSSLPDIEGLLDTPIVRSTGLLEPSEVDIEASPYKTPTKKDNEDDFELSPEFKLTAFRPVVKLQQPTLRRSRSLSYSADQIRGKFLPDITNTHGQQSNKPPRPPCTMQISDQPLKRRKLPPTLPKPFATSPPLRKSFDATATSSAEAGEVIPTRSRSISVCEGQGMDLPRITRTLSQDSIVDHYKLKLPTIRGSHPDLNCISADTVCDIIDGKYCQLYDEVFIIDCRFDFEYEGGHVMTARHMPNTADLKEFFIKNPILDRKVLIIFYCEFSSKRGPSGYRALRKFDREANCYPDLYYREVYLLEGGYKNFYEHHQEHCDPQSYVEMRDPQFNENMKKQYKELKTRHSFKRSRSLTFSRESFKKDFI